MLRVLVHGVTVQGNAGLKAPQKAGRIVPGEVELRGRRHRTSPLMAALVFDWPGSL